MALSIGIVGLPNVGKSTLFNALCAAGAQAANYPFCTIEPNRGVMPVPDPRLDQLARLFRPKKTTHTSLTFVDIAGLVRGASRGEGLGNQFLAHIREVDAVAHVLRCFDDPDVVHVLAAEDAKGSGASIDPVRDAEVIGTELCLKDLDSVSSRRDRALKAAKAPGKAGEEARAEVAVLDKLRAGLDQGRPVRALELSAEELFLVRDLFLLTAKPMLYVANVGEAQLESLHSDPRVQAARALAAREGAPMVAVASKVEAEIQELPESERAPFLASLGLAEPGLDRIVHAGYALLGLSTFLTAGEDECRAWTIRAGTRAPQAAGVIHSDFERGFIKAEVCRWDDLVRCGSEAAVREKGLMRIEGKEYVVQDGDVMHFRFAV